MPPDSSFITWLKPDFGDWGAIDTQGPRLETYIHALLAARKFRTWNLSYTLLKEHLTRSRAEDYAQLSTSVYSLYAKSVGKADASIGDKNNVYLSEVDILQELYPLAKYVWITRDVRDTFASALDLARMGLATPLAPRLPTDAEEFGSLWASANTKALASLSDIPDDQRIRITYEELVAQPTITLTEICCILNVDFEPRMLDAHRTNGSRNLEPLETMAWKSLTLHPPTSRRVGRWRDVLTSSQAQAVVEAAEPAFTALGYTSDTRLRTPPR